MRDQRITGCNRKQGCADGRNVSDHQSNTKHAGSTVSEFGDGRCDKADDDQRYTEVDKLPKDIFQSNDNIQDCHSDRRRICTAKDKSCDNAEYNAYQKFKRQAGKKTVFFHGFDPPCKSLNKFQQS